jgi:hypothetical protein
MEPVGKKDWRDVVHAYLLAYRDDRRRQLELGVSGSEAQFVREYGILSVKEAHDRAAKANYDSLGQPACKESYEAIEESEHWVLAQACRPNRSSAHEHPVPYWPTRFLLIEEEAGWKLAGIYHPCISCNSSAIDDTPPLCEIGKCFRCDGTGTDLVCKVRVQGFWVFKRRVRVTQPCKRCGGTGNCPQCAGEERRGWHSVFSLDGLTDTANKAQAVASPLPSHQSSG